jgi:hypothetical protein
MAVDPDVRSSGNAALVEHREAHRTWVELVGPDVDVHRAKALEPEVRAYHEALRSLGGAADEIEQLRRDVAEQAEPAARAARHAVAVACAAYQLDDAAVADVTMARHLVAGRIERGRLARRQQELERAEADQTTAADRLGQELHELGVDGGDLPARLGALEWAVARATERELARANARPTEVIEVELASLEERAQSMRRPEWSGVTADEADAPDVDELHERREKLARRLAERGDPVDLARLADRNAALERRVTALEARLGGDPAAVSDIQQHLLAHVTQAAQAGPHGDPVPVLLDEVFERAPAEHMWDLLDLLHRLSERHQLVYLSDDAFVAAWARQCPSDALMLLEPEPELEPEPDPEAV